MDDEKKAKAEAKKAEAEKIEKERAKRQQNIPGTEPDPNAPKKRGPGRPAGTGDKSGKQTERKPRAKRKKPEEIVDTGKALKQSYKDQQKLVKAHLKKHPEAKVAAIDPFTVKRTPLKLSDEAVQSYTHFGFKTLGGFMRVPSAVPSDEKLDMIGEAWARALPHMNIDAGRFYIAIAFIMSGSVILSMVALSVARLLGKYQDPLIDNVDSQLAGQLGALDKDGLDMVERQLRAQMDAELGEIQRRREQLGGQSLPSPEPKKKEKKDESN
jgi:hypothetical protein